MADERKMVKGANWKQGVLVTNAFLKTHKFTEHYDWLKEAAKQYHIALSLLDNTDLLYPVGGSEGHNIMAKRVEKMIQSNAFVLYWDKDIPLGMLLQSQCGKYGVPVFNTVDAIGICDNKFETYQKLWEWNGRHEEPEQIPMLPTIAAPMTYANVGYNDISFVGEVIRELGLPMVIKECYGSFGMQVYLARTEEEVCSYTMQLAGTPFLYQKYLEESKGRDVRLQVVGSQVVASMHRFSEKGDFRANITNGGSMEAYEPTAEECALAVRTVKALGLDFAGVDLLFGNGVGEEANVVCEVNSNAHFKNIYTCTGINVADCIMAYIREKIDALSLEEEV